MVICETQNRDCRVLIHTPRVAGARKMAAILPEGGCEVDIEPWEGEGQEVTRKWLGKPGGGDD
jgi:hypothetical protein